MTQTNYTIILEQTLLYIVKRGKLNTFCRLKLDRYFWGVFFFNHYITIKFLKLIIKVLLNLWDEWMTFWTSSIFFLTTRLSLLGIFFSKIWIAPGLPFIFSKPEANLVLSWCFIIIVIGFCLSSFKQIA